MRKGNASPYQTRARKKNVSGGSAPGRILSKTDRVSISATNTYTNAYVLIFPPFPPHLPPPSFFSHPCVLCCDVLPRPLSLILTVSHGPRLLYLYYSVRSPLTSHAHVVVPSYVLHFHFVRVSCQPIKLSPPPPLPQILPQSFLPNVRLYQYVTSPRSILYRPVVLWFLFSY